MSLITGLNRIQSILFEQVLLQTLCFSAEKFKEHESDEQKLEHTTS